MSARPRLFEDLSRIAGGALGTLSGIRQEAGSLARQTLDRAVNELHLVRREEFDAVMELAQRAKTESESLAEKLALLEERVRALETPPQR